MRRDGVHNWPKMSASCPWMPLKPTSISARARAPSMAPGSSSPMSRFAASGTTRTRIWWRSGGWISVAGAPRSDATTPAIRASLRCCGRATSMATRRRGAVPSATVGSGLAGVRSGASATGLRQVAARRRPAHRPLNEQARRAAGRHNDWTSLRPAMRADGAVADLRRLARSPTP